MWGFGVAAPCLNGACVYLDGENRKKDSFIEMDFAALSANLDVVLRGRTGTRLDAGIVFFHYCR